MQTRRKSNRLTIDSEEEGIESVEERYTRSRSRGALIESSSEMETESSSRTSRHRSRADHAGRRSAPQRNAKVKKYTSNESNDDLSMEEEEDDNDDGDDMDVLGDDDEEEEDEAYGRPRSVKSTIKKPSVPGGKRKSISISTSKSLSSTATVTPSPAKRQKTAPRPSATKSTTKTTPVTKKRLPAVTASRIASSPVSDGSSNQLESDSDSQILDFESEEDPFSEADESNKKESPSDEISSAVRLTARQRSLMYGSDDGLVEESPHVPELHATTRARSTLSAIERSEKARIRRSQKEKQLEEEKLSTIQKLLTKSSSSAKKKQYEEAPTEELEGGEPHNESEDKSKTKEPLISENTIRYIQNQQGSFLCFASDSDSTRQMLSAVFSTAPCK